MPALEGQGRYLQGALRLLQFVEARRPTGRRFGADADARWGSFRGDLRTVERIELMIRDADAEWPGAFGARTVYGGGRPAPAAGAGVSEPREPRGTAGSAPVAQAPARVEGDAEQGLGGAAGPASRRRGAPRSPGAR